MDRAAPLTRPTRRQALALAAGAGAALAAPAVTGQARARVVVVGGGPAGALAARRMAGALDVTLVEPRSIYRTCFFSNLAIGGFIPFEALAHGYEGVAAAGVRIAAMRATGVEEAEVALDDGSRLAFDHCVLAPGITYVADSVPGWSADLEDQVPSAYVTGGEPARIREQVLALPEGGTWCLVAPPDPARCPPAPYERASMVAHLLKDRNPTAKILILDPKDRYAKQALFEEGWQARYPGMIDRLGPDFGAGDLELRAADGEILVDGSPEAFDAINVIPAQKAAALAETAGVTDDSGWCPVDPVTLRSTLRPGLSVIGDAAAPGRIPKAASSATSEAEVCATGILHELAGGPPPDARYRSACWSAIADGDSVTEETVYVPGEGGLVAAEHRISQTGEDPSIRKANWDDAFRWYAGITAEIFG